MGRLLGKAFARIGLPFARVARGSAPNVWIRAGWIYDFCSEGGFEELYNLLSREQLADRAPTRLATLL